MFTVALEKKRAQALAALREAELHTGVTTIATPLQVASASAQSASAQSAPQPVDAATAATAASLPLPPELEPLVPGGRIVPGSVISVVGARSLLFRFFASASQAGGWLGVVGCDNLGVLAVAQAGLVLPRVSFVAKTGSHAATVCAALLDAMSIVIGSEVVLLDSERRKLAARARERGSVIFSETAWPGAQLTFHVVNRAWAGADHGQGWLRTCELTLHRTGRAHAARPQTFTVELKSLA